MATPVDVLTAARAHFQSKNNEIKQLRKDLQRRLNEIEAEREEIESYLASLGGELGNGRKPSKGGRAARGSGKGTPAAQSIPQVFADAFGRDHSGEKTAKEVEAYVKGKKAKFRALTSFIK